MISVIAAILKSLRENVKKSQKEVAAALGLDYKRYNHYETGRSEPDIATMVLLADYFGVTLDTLVGHEKKPGAESGSGLPKEDAAILYAYHHASVEDRQIMDFIVERYTPVKGEQTG